MDGDRFDSITRVIAGESSRRGVVRALAGIAAIGAALLAGSGDEATAREPRPRPPRPPRPRRCRSQVFCEPGEACRDGVCVTCWPEKIPCGDVCVDPLTDPANCGDCGIACAEGEVCGEGFCGLPCVDNCDCPDNLEFHCELGVCFGGGCSIVAMECFFGQPEQDCCKTADSLFCVDFRTDPHHCGRCYHDCGDAGCCDGVCCDAP